MLQYTENTYFNLIITLYMHCYTLAYFKNTFNI